MLSFDPSSQEFNRDPYPVLRALRESSPVYRWKEGGAWILTRFDDYVATLDSPAFRRDAPRRVASGTGAPRGLMEVFTEHSLTRTEGPKHRRLRGLISKAFSRRSIENLESLIQGAVDDTLEPLDPSAPMDLLADFANPFPAVVIGRLIGVERRSALEREFKSLADRIIRISDPRLAVEAAQDIEAALSEFVGKMRELMEARRREPRPDLLSHLIAAREDGEQLSEDEMIATLIILLLGGSETTAAVIAHGILELSQRPELGDRLERDPTLWSGVIEELLRYHHPGKFQPRIVSQTHELRGNELAAGDLVLVSISAAHRDPEVFPDPDRFDPERDTRAALPFGRGPHVCIGAALARSELRLALSTLFGRWPALRIDPVSVDYGPGLIGRNLQELRVLS